MATVHSCPRDFERITSFKRAFTLSLLVCVWLQYDLYLIMELLMLVRTEWQCAVNIGTVHFLWNSTVPIEKLNSNKNTGVVQVPSNS